jgi:hypothetical protein
MYNCVTAELEEGDLDRLPEVCMFCKFGIIPT